VDCPFELGPFWSGSFTACGIPHRFVVAGAPPSFDGAKLLADTQAICEAEIRFWHGQERSQKQSRSRKTGEGQSPIPFKHYVFMLNAVADGYGGLEHKNSTALICKRADLPRLPRTTLAPTTHKQPEGYTQLLGLISHEYFHTWNVKRLRPLELATYDYTQENYTELLWFFEGFTSYYDDLLLRRAGLIDNATYLKLLTKTVNGVAQTPGRLVQSVAQASFDAWVKYYRQDENTPNATVSYYTKGSLVGLCLDLSLRAEGKTSLDAVMRGLWARCQGGPMAEADLLAAPTPRNCNTGCTAPRTCRWPRCWRSTACRCTRNPTRWPNNWACASRKVAACSSSTCCAVASPRLPALLPGTSGWPSSPWASARATLPGACKRWTISRSMPAMPRRSPPPWHETGASCN